MIPGVFASIFAEKLKPHRIGVASQQPKNLRPMITSLDWLVELPHHFRPAKVYMYYMTWSGIWWSQVYNIVQTDVVYLCLGWWCHMSFLCFSKLQIPHMFRELLGNEASAFFAFLVAFYVMEDWDHHGVFLKWWYRQNHPFKINGLSMITGKTNGLRYPDFRTPI